jgi:metal-responsive CopG/Arc/MetJ family transcriptional regulator
LVDPILKISKKDTPRGEDGYKTFSIRIREETVAKLDEIAAKSNRSRNELVNIMLEFGIENSCIEE